MRPLPYREAKATGVRLPMIGAMLESWHSHAMRVVVEGVDAWRGRVGAEWESFEGEIEGI